MSGRSRGRRVACRAVGVVLAWGVAGCGAHLNDATCGVCRDYHVAVDAPELREFHRSLFIVDLHADPLMWRRPGGFCGNWLGAGHTDLRRMRAGNVAVQVIGMPSVTPLRGSYHDPDPSWLAGDSQRLLQPLQLGFGEWFSPAARTRAQAARFGRLAGCEGVDLIAGAEEWRRFREAWEGDSRRKGFVLSMEGLHGMDLSRDSSAGDIDRQLGWWRERGLGVVGLTHAFDNDFATSSEGHERVVGEGTLALTPAGRRVLEGLIDGGFVIDLAHASPMAKAAVVAEPGAKVLVTHSGVRLSRAEIEHARARGRDWSCQLANRVLSERDVIRVADAGGIIGIGCWPEAVGAADPMATAYNLWKCASIIDAAGGGAEGRGVRHLALGSDWDGAVTVAFAADQTIQLTRALRGLRRADGTRCFSDAEIRLVMGGNAARFLAGALRRTGG